MGIVLVLGGTKTGKTTFAENRAKTISENLKIPVHYIATAKEIDEEISLRIRKHRDKRPGHWITVEESSHVSEVINSLSDVHTVLILDCLTLLMTNLLFEKGRNCSREKAEEIVFHEVENIIRASKYLKSELIIISNQVENGLVSEHEWARMFQDIAGITHQKLAAAADHVYMMNAGLSQKLK
ncbi:MAG: bifunctional adenosylcobinamide kinase/adenosylcobinamide-phosphate guanylyltransferase [Spirochaetaceae bacterium]|jgi:adenosylcobinamide kinase/adenosylcobinamide-phosphate guanylyltransferase|nr:bifunctional adenosylcobinamide kinase/adenosylcobinamide-phosphate guanylyltransferase [Spirochaetaceae bacterium]